MVFRTSLECDFELAGKILIDRVTQQVPSQGVRIGRHIEDFVRRNSGILARGHVSNGVSASFSGGEAAVGYSQQNLRNCLAPDIMKLNVLSRSQVTGPVRRELVGNIRHYLELVRGQITLEDLHPDHMHVLGATYSVNSVLQPEPLEIVGISFALFDPLDFSLESLDLRSNLRRKMRCIEPTRTILADLESGDCCHYGLLIKTIEEEKERTLAPKTQKPTTGHLR
jgi:hypothetical protein